MGGKDGRDSPGPHDRSSGRTCCGSRCCDRAIAEKRSLRDVLAEDAELRPHISAQDIDRLMEPANYLGAAGVFVDRVVARVAALGVRETRTPS